jgi:hypothetical protein
VNFYETVGRRRRLRVIGDAAAIPPADWPELCAYEKKIEGIIKSSNAICLCAYPILRCSVSHTHAVLESHPDGALVGHF